MEGDGEPLLANGSRSAVRQSLVESKLQSSSTGRQGLRRPTVSAVSVRATGGRGALCYCTVACGPDAQHVVPC